MRDLLLAVDGNSLLHRAFHALPLMDNGGVYTNAVHGFLMMFFKVLREYAPVYAAVAFDEHAPTFRHQVYSEYKAGRKATPEELRSQFPILKEILTAMGVGVLSCAGWEADDILGPPAGYRRQPAFIYPQRHYRRRSFHPRSGQGDLRRHSRPGDRLERPDGRCLR